MNLFITMVLWGLVAWNWNRCRDWMHPGFLQSILWAFLVTWFAFEADSFDPVGGSTWILIGAACLSFTMGVRATTRDHKPFMSRNWIRTQEIPRQNVVWIVMAIGVLGLPFFVQRSIQLSSFGVDESFFLNLRYALGVEQEGYGLLVVPMWMAFAGAGLSVIQRYGTKSESRGTSYVTAACLLAFVYAYLMAGRNWILFLVLTVLGTALVLRMIGPWVAAGLLAASALLIFALISFLVQASGLDLANDLTEILLALRSTMAAYLLGPIAALDTLVRAGSTWDMGINTFSDISRRLNYLGLDFTVVPIVAEWVFVPEGINIYTSYRHYYLDFGLPGVILFQYLLGMIHGYLYRESTVHNPRPIFVSAYALSLFPLVMQPTTESYFAALNRWLIFFVILSLVYRRHRSPQEFTEAQYAH